ncbi:hypothetical protein C6Y45_01850 [Alkalicoccus saliphilus]|uniref:Uncharacterized protein n=1 Tax=Alkalicoccus saliphilus TaxID=200989 RepID=A0A2T4U9T0_9BACI|nr:hypothetical protein C6Y45_01850 [Alkalicoccus saliphilus]
MALLKLRIVFEGCLRSFFSAEGENSKLYRWMFNHLPFHTKEVKTSFFKGSFTNYYSRENGESS